MIQYHFGLKQMYGSIERPAMVVWYFYGKHALINKSNFHRVVNLQPFRDTVFQMLLWFRSIPLILDPTSCPWIATLGKPENSPHRGGWFRFSTFVGFI
jgi:hypothetical protein